MNKESTQVCRRTIKQDQGFQENVLGKLWWEGRAPKRFHRVASNAGRWGLWTASVACTEEHGQLKTQLLTSGTQKTNI